MLLCLPFHPHSRWWFFKVMQLPSWKSWLITCAVMESLVFTYTIYIQQSLCLHSRRLSLIFMINTLQSQHSPFLVAKGADDSKLVNYRSNQNINILCVSSGCTLLSLHSHCTGAMSSPHAPHPQQTTPLPAARAGL